jgi:NarL family two-component system response regulator LiaR
MSEARPIRVLIVDDHAMVRSGLKNFIYGFDWMEPVGEAGNGLEAVQFCATHDVDVVLMDMLMPIMDGSEATRRIKALGKPVKVIILTSFHEQNLVEQALMAGATSYLLKNVSALELAAAIQATHSGRSTLAPEATQALIQSTRQRRDLGFDLTPRELEVLALLVEGLSNQEISDQLSITTATVKYHLTNIFTKLGAKNRVEAATMAMEHELVDKSPD